MKSDYTTNSCYITHTIAFWKAPSGAKRDASKGPLVNYVFRALGPRVLFGCFRNTRWRLLQCMFRWIIVNYSLKFEVNYLFDKEKYQLGCFGSDANYHKWTPHQRFQATDSGSLRERWTTKIHWGTPTVRYVDINFVNSFMSYYWSVDMPCWMRPLGQLG